MTATPDPTRLHRLAVRLRLIVEISLAALILVAGAAILFPSIEIGPVSAHIDSDGLPGGWASAIAAPIVLALAAGLFELRAMLTRFAQGATFGPAVTRRLRRSAILFGVAAAANVVLPPLVMIWRAFAEHQPGMVSIHLHDLLPLLFALVFYFVAEAFDQAAVFETDSKGFI